MYVPKHVQPGLDPAGDLLQQMPAAGPLPPPAEVEDPEWWAVGDQDIGVVRCGRPPLADLLRVPRQVESPVGAVLRGPRAAVELEPARGRRLVLEEGAVWKSIARRDDVRGRFNVFTQILVAYAF